MKVWKITGLLLVALVLVLPFEACSVSNSQTLIPFSQTSVVRGDLTTLINSSGKVAFITDARLSFTSGGKLTALNVKEGDRVTQGEVLAKLDTTGLEASLAQARVSLNQARLARSQAAVNLDQALIVQAQADAALDQISLSQIQAESTLAAAQFNLDKVQAVSDIKDTISKLQQQITIAQVNARQSSMAGDSAGAMSMREYGDNLQGELDKQQQKLARLLNKNEYQGANSLTYDTLGQTYDRLTVEDARIKELAVEAAQKAVDQSASGISLAQKTIERSKDAAALAQQTLDQSGDGIALAQKNLLYIQKQIDDAALTAPFEGIVARLYNREGDVIPSPAAAPQIILYLVDPGHLKVEAKIDSPDIFSVQPGQKALIIIDGLPGRQEGRVDIISTLADNQSGGPVTSVAGITFDISQDSSVKAGMSAAVQIVTGEYTHILLLPGQAIKRDTLGKTYVQVADNQHILELPVVTGAGDGTLTEIVSGLKEGDPVVTGITWSAQKP